MKNMSFVIKFCSLIWYKLQKKCFLLTETDGSIGWMGRSAYRENYASYCPCRHIEFCRDSPLIKSQNPSKEPPEIGYQYRIRVSPYDKLNWFLLEKVSVFQLWWKSCPKWSSCFNLKENYTDDKYFNNTVQT